MRKHHVKIAVWTHVIVAIAAAGPGALADPPTYIPEFLGPGDGAQAINESGEVVGDITLQTSRGWVASSGTGMVLLPLPQGFASSRTTDINEAGVIVGIVSQYADPYYGRAEAAKWVPDGQGGYTVDRLGVRQGDTQSWATALNDGGDIVGYSSDGTYRYAVLFSQSQGVVDLSATGVFDPQDVNNRRMVVDVTGKRLDLNTMVVDNLGLPPGNYLATRAAVINEQNQVAGLAILTSGGNCDRQAARYTDGAGWEILSGCGYGNSATDMNDQGDVVMHLNVAPYILIEGVGTFQIETLIQNDVGHWYVINRGPSINNAGQVVVWAHNPDTNQAGTLLLTPVGAEQTAELTGYSIVTGVNLSGTLVDMRQSDDRWLRNRSGYGRTFTDMHHVEFLVEARTDHLDASFLDLTIEGRINQPFGSARIRLRNFTLNRFDQIHAYTVGNTDQTATIPGIPAGSYVDGAGNIQVSIKQTVVVPVFAFTFESFTDLVRIVTK